MGEKNSKSANVSASSIELKIRLDMDLAELEKKRKKFKKDNPNVANALNKVAIDYKNLADFENALKYELESLDMLKSLYPDMNHLAIAKSFNFVSGCYSMLGNPDKALSYSLDSYDIYQRFYKKPHENTAKQLTNVSTCYKNLNKFQDALNYALLCLKMRQDLYKNENHIDLAYSYSDIGFLYSALGKFDNGIKFSLKALEIYDNLKTFELHQDLAHLYNNIAMDYRVLGDHEKSFFYLKKSLEVIFSLYSGTCPEIAMALQSAAIGYKNLNDFDNCLKYSLIAVKMLEKLDLECQINRKHDSDIAELYSLVAISYFNLNDRQNCLQYSLESLRYYEKFLDSRHPKIARLKNNISIAYGTLGDAKKALEYAQDSLRIYKELYKNNHIDVARALANVGSAYGNMGDAFFCMKYSSEALRMFKSLYDGNHYDIAYALYNVACCYDDLGDKQNFLKYTLDSLRMHKELADYADNLDTALALKNVGLAYHKLNDALNALKYSKEALKIAKNLYREPHPLIAICLFCIAKSYRVSGDRGLEHDSLLKAFEMKHVLKKLFDYDIKFDLNPERFKFDEKQFKYKLKNRSDDERKTKTKKHIMISYCGDVKNRHECIEVKDILESKEYRVYVDVSYDHGKRYDDMTNAVDNSSIVILCINEDYIRNDYCKLEAAYALKQNKKVIPIIIDQNQNSRLINEWLDLYRLEERHCIYYRQYNLVHFTKILLNEINIKLSIISTNESLIDSNLEDVFRKNQVNSNLLNKLRPFDTEFMKSLAQLDSTMLQHIFSYLNTGPNDFTDDDVKKFKLCLNQIFV